MELKIRTEGFGTLDEALDANPCTQLLQSVLIPSLKAIFLLNFSHVGRSVTILYRVYISST